MKQYITIFREFGGLGAGGDDEQDKRQKAEELATQIGLIKSVIHMVDVDFARKTVKDMKQGANRMDSTAALNRKYNPTRSKLMFIKAQALELFCDFIDKLKESDKVALELGEIEKNMEALSNFLNG